MGSNITGRKGERTKMLTGVGLDPCSNLSGTDGIEEGDILTENGGEIRFTEALCADFRSMRPNRHEYHIRGEHANTYGLC